jgi:hypothetical protein
MGLRISQLPENPFLNGKCSKLSGSGTILPVLITNTNCYADSEMKWLE